MRVALPQCPLDYLVDMGAYIDKYYEWYGKEESAAFNRGEHFKVGMIEVLQRMNSVGYVWWHTSESRAKMKRECDEWVEDE